MKRSILIFLLVLAVVASSVYSFAGVRVARKLFSADVIAREPVEPAVTFSPEVSKVYFYTQFIDIGPPTTLVHVWIYNGQTVAEVALEVEGASWRTWSSKTIMPHQTGEWTVEVRDAEGGVIDSAGFTIE
jgi:hypothetical protein